jgi:hypothetical protein
MAARAAEAPERFAIELKLAAAHQMKNVFLDFVGFAAVKIHDRELVPVQPVKVLVVPVNKNKRKVLFGQPFAPVAFLIIVMPDAEVTADDYRIIPCQLFLYLENGAGKLVEICVAVAGNKYHDDTSFLLKCEL